MQVQISAEGKVTDAKLLKGIGFKIDDVVVSLAKGMTCTPAQKDGKDIGFWIGGMTVYGVC